MERAPRGALTGFVLRKIAKDIQNLKAVFAGSWRVQGSIKI